MPEVMVDLSVKHIANLIRSLSQQELETLYLLLTKEGEELLTRKKDLDQKKVKFLTREEVFDSGLMIAKRGEFYQLLKRRMSS